MKILVRLLIVTCIALFSATAWAQEPTGSIEGAVTDPQGAVVQGANVSVRNAATNFNRSATSDDNGRYRISQLPPGTYEVKVTGTNFKTSVVSDVVVAVGQTLPLDVHLEVGGASETVTVIGGGDVQIDRTDNTVSGVVNTRQIQNLPLNGRNFLDLAQLQPGVEKVEGGNFDPTKANYTGVSIAGQAGRSAQIAVDGGSFHAEKARLWSEARYQRRGIRRMFDLHPDGERFALAPAVQASNGSSPDTITMILNFSDELRRLTTRP